MSSNAAHTHSRHPSLSDPCTTAPIPTHCVSIRRGGGGRNGRATLCTFRSGGATLGTFLWTAAVYVLVQRKDGSRCWRYSHNVGRCVAGDRPSSKLRREAEEIADAFGYPFMPSVKQGSSL